jgi:hypothetical protein
MLRQILRTARRARQREARIIALFLTCDRLIRRAGLLPSPSATGTSTRRRGPVRSACGPAILLVVLGLSYVVIAGSTVSLQTVQWDEFTDLVIAGDIAERPLRGSVRDPSQARLPMYVIAAAYRLIRWRNPDASVLDALIASRWISILMTVLAIWATAALGWLLFDRATAMLGASLFTFSPLVLHFGRDALTQGDAFTPGLVACALIAFVWFERSRTTSSLFLLSVSLGLAIASKFTLVVIVPALMTYGLLRAALERYRGTDPLFQSQDRRDEPTAIAWRYAAIALATGLAALTGVVLSLARTGQAASVARALDLGMLAAWAATLLGLTGSALLAIPQLERRWSRGAPVDRRWPLCGCWLIILPLAAATSLAIVPEHLFNRGILLNLLERAMTRDGTEFFPTALASAKLYVGMLLFKLGIPFGVATWLALPWALARSSKHRGLLLMTVTLAWYGLMLLALPLHQPFWLMSVYPIVVLVLSAAVVHHLRWHGPRLRVAVAAALVGAFVWMGVGIARVYPTFGYYGYETVGDTWLGMPSRGYRSLVVVTNDGSTEALDWLREHAAGAVVLSYLDDIFLINSLNELRPFPFELRHGLHGDADSNDELLRVADFVVVRAIDDLDRPSPVSAFSFAERFEPASAHEIVRGRGVYRMPVIQIYRRRSE